MRIEVIFIIFLFSLSFVNAQEYVKIKYFYYPKNIVVTQGQSNSTMVVFENNYNETLYNIILKFQLPAGIEAIQNPNGIEELFPGKRGGIKFSIKATSISNGTYNVVLWGESANQIGSNYIQSPKYTFNVTVIKANISSTTTTVVTTTVEKTTFHSTTTILKTTIQEKKSSSPTKKILASIAFIVILVGVFILMRR